VNAQTTLPKASKIPEKKVMEVNPPKTTFEKYEPSPLDSDTSSRKLTVEKSKFVISPDVMPAYIGGEVALYNFIQDYMIYPLAEFILNENPQEGSTFSAVMNDEKTGLKITLLSETKAV